MRRQCSGASWKEGRRHAVECDLKSFFDTVNHDRLMNALKEKVRCLSFCTPKSPAFLHFKITHPGARWRVYSR